MRFPILFQGMLAVILSATTATFAQEPKRKADPAKSESSAVDAKSDVVGTSVVKVFSTVRYPDPYKPWSKQSPSEISGSGVVIEKKRILSNAHVVLYASQVQVQANQSGDKVSATVEAIAPGIDLAVLKVDDESFFDSHPPLPRLNTLPEIKDAVMAYGFPKGGTSLSITKGIVSRIDFSTYNYPVSGLRIQIDAAINSGNSGGPAVVGDKMIGLCFSRLGDADNIGYIIPCEEIELFLQDMADGKYDGKPAIYDDFQTLENPALRTFLKLKSSDEGMVVQKPDSSDASYPLKKWDVISKIGDTPVDNQGMIKLGSNLRVNFTYLVQKIAKDGKLPLTVIREGKEAKIELPVSTRRPMVIPPLQNNYPAYFAWGPLVFSEATTDFIGGFSRGGNRNLMGLLGMRGSPLIKRISDKPAFEGERLVVISSPFFPHKLSKGYSNPQGETIKSVNDTKIKNLAHLVEVLRDLKSEFVTFDFDSRSGETMVFPRAEMTAATDDILTDNGVRSQGSPDMLAIWNKGKQN